MHFNLQEVKCVVADDTDVLILLHGAPEHNKYIFSFRGWETFKYWKIDDIIGHIQCRSYCNIIITSSLFACLHGVAVIQHLQHLNRVKLANQEENDVQVIARAIHFHNLHVHLQVIH